MALQCDNAFLERLGAFVRQIGRQVAIDGVGDVSALGDDVESGAVAVSREKANGFAFGFAVLADFLGQTDGSERAVSAEAVVIGDGRPFEGIAKLPGFLNRIAESLSGGIITLLYALHQQDPVFIAGQSLGVFIYLRNIYFLWYNLGNDYS